MFRACSRPSRLGPHQRVFDSAELELTLAWDNNHYLEFYDDFWDDSARTFYMLYWVDFVYSTDQNHRPDSISMRLRVKRERQELTASFDLQKLARTGSQLGMHDRMLLIAFEMDTGALRYQAFETVFECSRIVRVTNEQIYFAFETALFELSRIKTYTKSTHIEDRFNEANCSRKLRYKGICSFSNTMRTLPATVQFGLLEDPITKGRPVDTRGNYSRRALLLHAELPDLFKKLRGRRLPCRDAELDGQTGKCLPRVLCGRTVLRATHSARRADGLQARVQREAQGAGQQARAGRGGRVQLATRHWQSQVRARCSMQDQTLTGLPFAASIHVRELVDILEASVFGE